MGLDLSVLQGQVESPVLEQGEETAQQPQGSVVVLITNLGDAGGIPFWVPFPHSVFFFLIICRKYTF